MSASRRHSDPRHALSRRSLLKVLPFAGIALAGETWAVSKDKQTRVVEGTCFACLGRCGVRATLEQGRIVRVEGDPESKTGGFICIHGMAIREIVHSPHRLRRPLARRGDSLVEIGWDRALSEIAERLNAIKEEFGPQSVALHAGWGLVGHPIQGFLLRFCQAFGTPNFSTVNSLCETAGRMGQALTVGAKLRADASNSRTVVLWGANPTDTSPVWARVLAAATRQQGRNLIVIDPVRTDLARRAALHLQVRPGSDGALALGLMHVIVAEGLFDRSYVERFTLGFEPLKTLIADYSPGPVSQVTSVPPERIVEAAHLIARDRPTSIWPGLGVEHHENGLQTVRAITSLSALCGQIDIAGGNALATPVNARADGAPLPGLLHLATPDPVPPPTAARPIGYDTFPLFEMYNKQAQANLFARAILEDDPYPLRALLLIGSNAFVTSPDSARMRKAADKLSLLVSIDPFLNRSGELADYVLPAATFAEGPAVPEGRRAAASRPLLEPQHESRTDWRILVDLSAALGLERFFPWSSLEEAMGQSPKLFMWNPERTVFAETTPPGERPRFPTASGKVEFYSRTLERFGHDPLPAWRPSRYRSARYGIEFPLLLVTGPRGPAYINSQFRQIPSVRRKAPHPLAEIHPEVATSHGIADGDLIEIVSPHGRIEMHARVTERVHPECVVLPAGWAEANANVLTDDTALDPITGFPEFRSGVCRIVSRRGKPAVSVY